MKTTVDIQDSLLEEAKKVATKQRTSVRALIEQGLRHVLGNYKKAQPFQLRKVTFKGNGLQPAMEGQSWDRVRELAYKGRGG